MSRSKIIEKHTNKEKDPSKSGMSFASIPKKTIPPRKEKSVIKRHFIKEKQFLPQKTPSLVIPDSKEEDIPEGTEDVSEETEGTKEKKVRAPRKKITLDSHLARYKSILEDLDVEIDRKSREKEKGTRFLQRVRKQIRELQKEVPKVASKRKFRNPTVNRISGFLVKKPITDECAKFLKVDTSTPLSRREVTNAICVYAHLKLDETRPQMLKWKYLNPDGRRNLQRDDKKIAINPDSTIIKLLRFDSYQRDVREGKIKKKITNRDTGEITEETLVDDTLYYWVIQKLISHLFQE